MDSGLGASDDGLKRAPSAEICGDLAARRIVKRRPVPGFFLGYASANAIVLADLRERNRSFQWIEDSEFAHRGRAARRTRTATDV